MVDSKEPGRFIEEQIDIPSPPAIAIQILDTVQNEESSVNDLVRIISADPALTGKLLKVANSNFYSLQNNITSVDRAISVLGTEVIKNIALSFVITSQLSEDGESSFNIDFFWRRSITSAVAAELLKKATNLQNDAMFVTALLQDIGILLLYMSKQDEYLNILKERKNTQARLIDLEQREFNFDHQQVGFFLVSNWGLPESIALPIKYHHISSEAPPEYQRSAEILKIADLMATIYSEKEAAGKVRQLHEEMVEHFSMNSDEIETLLDEVAYESIEILETFEIDPGKIKPYSQILQKANTELGKINLSYEQVVLELKQEKDKAERFAEQLQKANSQLKKLISRDGLTGLYNHLHFQETLEKEIARSRRYGAPLSLIMLDIDFFKKINDNFGHASGDLVLKNIGRVIRGAVRSSDIVARYGGEEFAVILPETGETGLRVFAERLRRSIEKTSMEIGKEQINVTISAGGATLTPGENQVSKQMVIEAADQALYSSKRNGRNRFTMGTAPLATEN
ncbi:MAG: GGDEF domain-containing protein [Desulfocapsaceae bacterium]|nr:GGDEF domain-containing protein [Desulfocapsaceae bacterium]